MAIPIGAKACVHRMGWAGKRYPFRVFLVGLIEPRFAVKKGAGLCAVTGGRRCLHPSNDRVGGSGRSSEVRADA
jgi:hypothetical protein